MQNEWETNYKNKHQWVKDSEGRCRISNTSVVHVGNETIFMGQFEMWTINSRLNHEYSLFGITGIFPSQDKDLIDDTFEKTYQIEL